MTRLGRTNPWGMNMLQRLASVSMLFASLYLVRCDSDSGLGGRGGTVFELTLPTDSDLDVAAGSITVAYLLAVGADGDVVFTADGLPDFATLEGNKLTLAPQRTDAGRYEVSITATAGTESDTKMLAVLVAPPNAAPVLGGLWVVDYASGGYPSGTWGACFLDPFGDGAIDDADGDEVKFEAEVVPTGVPATGVATHSSAFGPTGQRRVDLTGFAPDVPYDLYFRAVDSMGAASAWVRPNDPTEPLACIPVAIERFTVTVWSERDEVVTINLLGVGDAPYVLTATNLPPFATLDGNVLTFDTPVITTIQNYGFELQLEALGYTAHLFSSLSMNP